MYRMTGAFSVTYDGPAMDSNRMDVRELAPALLGFADAIERARDFTPGAPPMRLEIEATRKGSFNIDFILSELDNLRASGIDLFTSDTAQALAAFSAVRDLVVGTVIGAVQIAKYCRKNGSQPSAEKAMVADAGQSEPAVRLIWHTGDVLEVSNAAWETFNDHAAMRGLAKAAAPLSEDSIDSLVIKTGASSIELTAEEKDALVRPEQGVDVNSFEARTVVWPIDITFRDNGKWRVTDGQSTFYARVEDEKFRARVDLGTERFGKRDSFLVILRTVQREVDGLPSVEKIIVEVLEHREGGRQGEFELD